MKNIKFALLVLVITIPTFIRLLRPGIFSMQDFHLFRLFEFDKCIKSLQIPCRWSPDAGLGYGEPIFNFYGQISYALGEIFHLIGASFSDSLKLIFIISIAGSGVAMYFLGKKIWQDPLAGIISAVIYIYAPYRAVDVWVRGAVPEALSFILFPLIILSIEKKNLLWFSLSFALLVLTHNLSALMFLPFVLVWLAFRKFWKGFLGFLISAFLSSFYILPIIFESKFVNLISTTQGYFDFRAHFITLKQIFVNFYWGYGGSTWGDADGMNLSVGLLQWVLPGIGGLIIILKHQMRKSSKFLILFTLGLFYLFLTHNKSTLLWETLPFMKFIQFPWRFLGVAVFSFALASGAIIPIISKWKALIVVIVVVISILLNLNFFREDIWYKVSDSYFLTGEEWNRQRSASIGDFWPNFGHEIPQKPSDGKYLNYFPGWVGANPDQNGLIPVLGTKFTDTPIRKMGNIVSLVSILGLLAYSFKMKIWKEKI